MGQAVVAGLVAVVALGATAWYATRSSGPAVFESIAFDEALARSQQRGDWLVVKVTANWCPPCKTMDRTTFSDEGVVEWVRANGAAIALDVDKHPAEAARLGVRGLPTTILLHRGQEVGRVSGSVPPAMFLSWLNSAGG
jgi:thioredoxin 2